MRNSVRNSQTMPVSAFITRIRPGHMLAAVLVVLMLYGASAVAQTDPLPSWNDGPAKESIIAFVAEVTKQGGPNYVPPEDRIATFDQDGTTWVSHPLYAQAVFALDRIRELAPLHPEWKNEEPFKSVISGDKEAISKFGESDWESIIAATHTGMSTR
ncbi:MAG: hypothetical protein F9K51_00770, partial [Candidatus Dadabacteria bacterium]